jgi:uncharacterized Zn finger protein (UPF0148 family)
MIRPASGGPAPSGASPAGHSAPHCPEDDVVMLAIPGGWLCPECGHLRQSRDPDETSAADRASAV